MDISGKHIVITRPAHQAENLAKLITSRGGHAILFPVIEITDAHESHELDEVMSHLQEFDLAIFISANAVEYGMKRAEKAGGFPADVKIAAVGAATARALTAFGRQADIFPKDSFNSEALLALDAFKQLAGKNIVIFRGDGGRELLANTLRERSANVSYAEVYRREKPEVDLDILMSCLKNNQVDAIIVTSNQGLRHLWEMAGSEGQSLLQNTQLVVISERNLKLAQQLGFKKMPVVSTNAGDNELLEALISCE